MISRSQVNSAFAMLAGSISFFLGSILSVGAAEPAPPLALFAVPAPSLRLIDSQSTEGQKAKENDDVKAVSKVQQPEQSSEITVESKRLVGLSEGARTQLYEGLNGPILSQVEVPEEPAGALGWVQMNMWEPIFAMESIQIRKVHITGSIVTAIQKKNPLCLLNPLVLAIDF